MAFDKKEYYRQYYLDKKELYAERNKKWASENKERRAAQSQKYRDQRTPEEVKEYRAKDRQRARGRDKEKRKAYRREAHRANPLVNMLQSAKYRAAKNDLPFDLTIDDLVLPDVCPILGCPMVVGTDTAPSLDKEIPSLGYVKGNVSIMSRKANMMKQDATPEMLIAFADYVYKKYKNER
jgi:hypothetical protein